MAEATAPSRGPAAALRGVAERLRGWRRGSPSTDPETPADAAPVQAASPTAYRTFSKKFPAGLTALGGALALAGGLGAWIRATETQGEGFVVVREVAVEMGYASRWGVAIAAAGALTMVAALLWLAPALLPKLLPVVTSGAVIALAAWRMPIVFEDAAALAEEARKASDLDFTVFHSGPGWGAWCVIGAALLLGLGVLVGVLRELDVRRGIPE